MPLTPAMETALAADGVLCVGMIEVNFNDGRNLRLLDGSLEVMRGADKFAGEDPVFGAIGSVEVLRDGVGDEAPEFDMTLIPPQETETADLAAADMQGSRVRVWLGVVVKVTGLLVADPDLRFEGEIDVATTRLGKSMRVIDYRCISALERFHDNAEGARLSDSHHQGVWPGETGLANMTGIGRVIKWGVEPSPSNITTGRSADVAGAIQGFFP
jgi:hypothetical protein